MMNKAGGGPKMEGGTPSVEGMNTYNMIGWVLFYLTVCCFPVLGYPLVDKRQLLEGSFIT